MKQEERIAKIIELISNAESEIKALTSEEQKHLEQAVAEESEMEDDIRIVLDDLKECNENANKIKSTLSWYTDGLYY